MLTEGGSKEKDRIKRKSFRITEFEVAWANHVSNCLEGVLERKKV